MRDIAGFTLFVTALTALLLCATACSITESLSNKDERIAQIGNSYLYKADLQKVLPRGISREDSIHFARRFINSWALKELMVLQAQKQLPKSDKDVDELVNEYKNQLLIYRYENRYIEQKLDTNISQGELESYYLDHRESFATAEGIVKGLLISMHKSSPALQKVISLAQKESETAEAELNSAIYNTAYRYDNYQDKWVDLAIVAQDMNVDRGQLGREIAKSSGMVKTSDSVYVHILRIGGFVKGGELTPLEYNEKRIKELILTTRKQKLLMELHTNIVQDAINENTLKITDNEEN